MSYSDSDGGICADCGLCCDGTLFSLSTVPSGERQSVEAAGLAVEEIDGVPAFRQPCRQLCGTRCQIYPQRPPSCRKFRCRTLRNLDAGEIDAAEAGRRIATAREAASRFRNELLPGETIPQARVRLEQSARSGSKSRADDRARLMLGALEIVLGRSFRAAGQQAMTTDD